MRRWSWAWGGLVAALACSGCYESRLGTVSDGAIGEVDGRSTSTSDAGSPRDAGPARDAGRRDAGTLLTCRDPVGPYAGPRCRPETVDCLGSCEGPEDCQLCYEADGNCLACLYQSLTECANALRCQALWEAFACCAEASRTCRDLEPTTILFECGSACPAQGDAWAECVNELLSVGECEDLPTVRCVP